MSDIDKKELLLVEYMISDIEIFAKAIRIMKPSYFEKPLNLAVEFIDEYFTEYKAIPATEIIDAETGVELVTHDLDPDQVNYALESIEKFCQQCAMVVAINDASELITDGDSDLATIQDLVREALLVKMDDQVGVELFVNAQERIETTEANVDKRKIGIDSIDRILNGIRRREVGVVYGTTGAGKSVMLGNFAQKLSQQGLDVLLVTLEINESLYAMRLDTIFSGMDINHHKELGKEIADFYEEKSGDWGRIVTRYMRKGTAPSRIRTVAMEYQLKYKKPPDVIMVDYLQLMGVDKTKSDNKFDLDEERIFALQSIGDDFDCYVFTAGQLNRDGADIIDVSHRHVAGGLSAVNGSDWAVVIVASDEDIENNQLQMKQLKIRNGARTMKPITLYKCPKSLRISDAPLATTGTGAAITRQKKKQDEAPKVDVRQVSSGKEKLRQAMRLGKGGKL